MEQTYFCPNCNAHVAYGTNFCGSCGTQLMWHMQNMQTVSVSHNSYRSKTVKARGKVKTSDQKWANLNKKLLVAMQQGNWYEIGILNHEQALFLEKEGKESARVRQESLKAFRKARQIELLNYQKSGVLKVEALTAGNNSCPACMKLHGKIYTIMQALIEFPLPVVNCEGGYGYCRCCYIPVID